MKKHKQIIRISTILPVMAFIILAIAACDDDTNGTVTPTIPDTYSLKALSGNDQTGEIDKKLAKKIQVRLENQDGEGIEGKQIDFEIISGGGEPTVPVLFTDNNGVAEVTWTLGSELGEQKLKAKVNDNKVQTNPVEFKAIAKCPETVKIGSKNYKVAEIGSQCWCAENLDIGTRVDFDEQKDNNKVEKSCYQDSNGNCTTYGGLYSWKEAMQYAETSKSQGICPSGWHIPSKSEWEILVNTLGGTSNAGGKMKANGTSFWDSPNTGATDSHEFKALGAGRLISRFLCCGYVGQKQTTGFWTSTKGTSAPLILQLDHDSKSAAFEEPVNAFYLYSCRCVKD